MAGERCNLDKDEAELLKPPSTTPSSPPPAPPPTSPLTTQQPSITTSPTPTPPPLFLSPPIPPKPEAASPHPANSAKAIVTSQPPPARSMNRCSSCKKKVGLTGFRCRCGELFCGRHRYSDAHGCSFDYKALGREEIARNNPVVRAAKILKI